MPSHPQSVTLPADQAMTPPPLPKPNWAEIFWLLLCGLLAAVCLLLLPFAPMGMMPFGLGVALAVGVPALVIALRQMFIQRRSGLIETRSVQHEGGTHPAFVILYIP